MGWRGARDVDRSLGEDIKGGQGLYSALRLPWLMQTDVRASGAEVLFGAAGRRRNENGSLENGLDACIHGARLRGDLAAFALPSMVP